MQKERFKTKKLVLSALFVTLALVMSQFLKIKISDSLVFSCGGYPLVFGGMVLGPTYGFMVGVATDLLKFAMSPSPYGFNVFYTILEGRLAWFPGFILWKLSKGEGFAAMQNNRKLQNIVIISSSVFRALFLNIIMNTILLYPYVGAKVFVELPFRAVKNGIEIFTFYFVLTALVEGLRVRKISFEI